MNLPLNMPPIKLEFMGSGPEAAAALREIGPDVKDGHPTPHELEQMVNTLERGGTVVLFNNGSVVGNLHEQRLPPGLYFEVDEDLPE